MSSKMVKYGAFGLALMFATLKLRSMVKKYDDVEMTIKGLRNLKTVGVPVVDPNALFSFTLDLGIYNPYDIPLNIVVRDVIPKANGKVVGRFIPNNLQETLQPKSWGTISNLDFEIPLTIDTAKNLQLKNFQFDVVITINGIRVPFSV